MGAISNRRDEAPTRGSQRAQSPVERLLQLARPHESRRLAPRELIVEAAVAAAFVLVATAMALLVPSDREFQPLLALVLVGSYALAARIRLYLGAGYAIPTQLVLLPMLFAMPVAMVPALVACALALSACLDMIQRRAHPERIVTGIADAWHAIGSSAVLALAGEPAPAAAAWPLVAGALVAQCGIDLVASIVREWFGRGIAPSLQVRVVGSVYLIDGCLTPIGMLAALASAGRSLELLAVCPLLLLLAAFASDRRARIAEVGLRLDQLKEERARLDTAIRRIGDAFASKLDAAALAELALRTAVEALDAPRGRVALTSGTIHVGTADAVLDALLDEAVHAASRHRTPRTVTRGHELFATAYPLARRDAHATPDVLVVGRRGRNFSEDEHALLGYLASQAGVAMENVTLHDELRRQVMVDDLTGLANRRRFQRTLSDEAERSRRSQRPVGLVMLDIDNFKAINDVHGHQQGDAVLRAVAAAIRNSCRSTDEPARYGGEEFAVVLPETEIAGSFNAAETMRRAVEALEIPLPGGSSLHVTVSAGTSVLAPGGDPKSLVASADAALYEAKRRGKNTTVRKPRPGGLFTSSATRKSGADRRWARTAPR